MSFESVSEPVKTFNEIERRMEANGFTYQSRVPLTKFRFGGNAKFETVSIREKEDILKEYSDGDTYEVRLVDVPNLPENQKTVFVFSRKKT